MLFIFGISPKSEPIGRCRGVCLVCGRAVDFHLNKKQSVFSFFFIPVIRFGTSYTAGCPNCGSILALSKEKGSDFEHDGRTVINPDDLEILQSNVSPACPSCGAKIIVNQNFCYHCGVKL